MARIVVFGAGGAQSYDLGDGALGIGRAKGNRVVIEDGAASRHHCEVRSTDDGEYALVDLESANGTHVNGLRVTSHPLEAEDRIKIGRTIIVFKER